MGTNLITHNARGLPRQLNLIIEQTHSNIITSKQISSQHQVQDHQTQMRKKIQTKTHTRYVYADLKITVKLTPLYVISVI